MDGGGSTVVARVGLDDTGFQEGINKLQRSLKLVQSEFAAASSKLGDFSKSTEGLKLKADSLTKQMDLQKQKVAALNQTYQESVTTKGEDAKATEYLKIKLNYAMAEMNKLGGELSELNDQITIQSSNFTKFGKSLEGVGSSLKSASERFAGVGDTLNKTVTVPILAAGAGLFKLAGDFDDASDTIRTTTGATGESLNNLEADFKAVYASVNTNIGDASKVVSELNVRTGLAGKPLQELASQMLKLAKVTGEDINTLIPAAARMFQDAGIDAKDYAKALDYTYRVSQSTGIGLTRLQELMTQFGGPLRQMGFDWQTSAAMLGKFEKEGVNTELVVGSLRIALGKMAKEGIKDPSKALGEMVKKIKEAGTSGKANTLALEMFGAKAGPDMAAAIREGRLELDGLIAQLKNSPETIDQAASDTADAADQFIILKNKLSVALKPLGKVLFDGVNNAMPAIEKLIGKLIEIIEKFSALSPIQKEIAIKLALIAVAIGPVMSIFAKLLSITGFLFSTFGSLSTAIGAAGGASAAIGTVFTALTGPIAIILAAIAGFIGIFVLLYRNNEAFRNNVNQTWSEVRGVIKATIESLKGLFQAFIALGKDLWSKYGKDVIIILNAAVDVIKNIVETILKAIRDIIKIGTSLLKGDWKGAWEGLKSLTATLWNGIKATIQSVLGLIKGLLSLELKLMASGVSMVWNGIKNTTKTVWDGIKSAVETPVNALKNTVKTAIDAILAFFKNLKIPELKIPKIKLPHFSLKGSFNLSPPSVPSLGVEWYAKGGIFTRPSVIGVGEAGTEAVLPINRLEGLLAGALEKLNITSTKGLTLHIENFNNNSDKDIETLAYELQFYMDRISKGKGGK